MKEAGQRSSISRAKLLDAKGKESSIAEYCRDAQTAGHKSCIWICMGRGAVRNMQDIPVANTTQLISLDDVCERYGWWKRYSLYSVIAVEQIMVHVLDYDQNTKNISVAWRNFDCEDSIKSCEKDRVHILKAGIRPGKCLVDMKGIHSCNESVCENHAWDAYSGKPYCKRRRLDELDLKCDHLKWLTSKLAYFWGSGIDQRGIDFLRKAGFIYTYEALVYNRFYDAANPYGQTINAFQVVEGWNIGLLLKLLAFGVFLTICVVSIITVVFHSLATGLTAGSYAVGLLAVLLAIFSLLSAIL